MINQLKKALYFPLANYFKFFAKIRLARWNPRVIVVTGSSGKTTLLHLIESQLGPKARYSHHANSAYGIPFNILGLKRESLEFMEWPYLFLMAPVSVFKKLPLEKFYVVEADCDRPEEGKFLASLLNPEICLWLSVSKTHSMNFEKLVENKKFQSVGQAIANEFGYFLEYTSNFSIVNGDSKLIEKQLCRAKSKVLKIKKEGSLENYEISLGKTEFKISGQTFRFKVMLPEETFYAIAMCSLLLKNLDIKFDEGFSRFILPPGRSSYFKGKKNTLLIDSTYNANLSSVTAILNMFDKIKVKNKWVVLGDMLEQGGQEKEEHEKLAQLISPLNLDRVILMGPRVSSYTYPKLTMLRRKVIVEKFTTPREVLDYLEQNISGGEALLFKGARFLEGVIEHLLENSGDVKNLSRREAILQARRKQWDL